MLILLSGVSGAGKDTIKKELIKRMENVKKRLHLEGKCVTIAKLSIMDVSQETASPKAIYPGR